MKSAPAIASIALLSAAAFAQQTPPTTPPAPQNKPAAPAPDPASVKQGQEVLKQSAKAYKDAKSLTDTLMLQIKMPQGEQTHEVSIAVGPGNEAKVGVTGATLTAVDGKVYVTREDVDDKYYVTEFDGDLSQTIGGILSFVPPQIAARQEQSEQEQLASFTMTFLENPQVAGHQMTTSEQGKELNEVLITGDEGKGSVLIDPHNKLIQQVKLQITPPMMPQGTQIEVNLTMSPQVHETLPTPIAFEAGARKAVDSLDQLEPTPLAEGEAAPDFTLPTLNGETVTLSSLKGSAVVLDFWATWCGPCRRALPELQKFAQWAETSDQPIKVYAVDVMERTSSPEQTKTKVGEFWKSNAFTFPTLLDLDNSVAKKYRVSSIPMTVIVNPEGKIFKIHVGMDPSKDMVEMLKEETAAALKGTPG